MKIRAVQTIIAFGISALLAYALYELCHTDNKEMLLAIGGGICLFLPLVTCLSVRFNQPRTTVNVAVVGAVFFVLMLISNALFAYLPFKTHTYVIVNGIILLLFLLITYLIANAKQ